MSVTYGGDKITFDDGSSIASGLTNFRNRIINGDMRINQRGNTSYSINSGNIYTVDRWEAVESHANSVYSVQQSSDVPTGSGFSNSAIITITTAGTTGAGDVSIFRQNIEGFNVGDFDFGTASAKTISLSFWVKSSVTGTYALAVSNSANNRHYIRHYTINSANTWEYKTVTIPGDTTGTWLKSNDVGLRLKFTLAAGTTYQGTVDTWNAGDVIGTSSSVNLTSTLNATWQITGVQLEVGSFATTFERRPHGLELAMCQRYFVSLLLGYCSLPSMVISSGNMLGSAQTPVTMRTTPSVSSNRGANMVDTNNTTPLTTSAAFIGGGAPNFVWIVHSRTGGGTVTTGGCTVIHSNEPTLSISAEF